MNPRQRPTLPPTCAGSTIGGSRLNFRVRNGNGCDPTPMTTGKLFANLERRRGRCPSDFLGACSLEAPNSATWRLGFVGVGAGTRPRHSTGTVVPEHV